MGFDENLGLVLFVAVKKSLQIDQELTKL